MEDRNRDARLSKLSELGVDRATNEALFSAIQKKIKKQINTQSVMGMMNDNVLSAGNWSNTNTFKSIYNAGGKYYFM